MGMRKAQPLCVAACVALVFASLPAGAQELEPRAYSPAPVGMNFVTLGLSQSSGGVAVDPTLPLDNVETTFQTATVGYQRTFALAGRTASAGVIVPYGWGEASGEECNGGAEPTSALVHVKVLAARHPQRSLGQARNRRIP